MFQAGWIRKAAVDSFAKVRVRKIDIVPFFWCLVMNPNPGACQTLADMQKLFHAMACTRVCRSSFLKRFNEGMVRFLMACIRRAIDHMSLEVARPELFDPFKDVLAIDSTVIALADGLASVFPGTRTNTSPAAAKLNAMVSVISGSVTRIAIAPENTAEVNFMKIGKWVKDTLLLFDLGYYSHACFKSIDRMGGFFVSRLKANVNPTILSDNTRGPGRRRDLRGKKVRSAIKGLHKNIIDVNVRVVCKSKRRRRNGEGHRTVQTMEVFRVVGLYNEEARQYHLYITNVGVETMSVAQIAGTYSGRWIVEQTFMELKHRYSMHGIPGRRPEVVRCLILVAVLNLLVNRAILDLLRRRFLVDAKLNARFDREVRKKIVRQTPTLRFSSVFAVYGPMLIVDIFKVAGLKWSSRHLENLMMLDMIDPNKKRRLLVDRLDITGAAA